MLQTSTRRSARDSVANHSARVRRKRFDGMEWKDTAGGKPRSWLDRGLGGLLTGGSVAIARWDERLVCRRGGFRLDLDGGGPLGGLRAHVIDRRPHRGKDGDDGKDSGELLHGRSPLRSLKANIAPRNAPDCAARI